MNATTEQTLLTKTWEIETELRFQRIRLDLGEDVFQFAEAVKQEFPISETEVETRYSINAYTIELGAFSEREILDCIEQYGFELLDEVGAVYGMGYEKVLAEWLYTDVNVTDKEIATFTDSMQAADMFLACFGLTIEF